MDKQIYGFILEFERMLFMRYHVDPFMMEKSLSIMDLRVFHERLEQQLIEENKEMNEAMGGNKLMKSLAAIRDVLNLMFSDKTH